MAYAIKVIWRDGQEEFLKQGMSAVPARFVTRESAKEQADFMKMGMDDGDCQSVNVVRYPEIKVARK